MKHFIYPKGKNGELIASLIGYFEKEISVEFIDDAIPENSLEQVALTITDQDLILISSKKYKKVLLEKIEKYHIKNHVDGIDYYAKKLNHYILNNKKQTKKPIGILLRNLSNNKHLGDIDKNLIQKGYEIVYICENIRILEANKDKISNHLFIVAGHDVLSQIDEISLFITTNGGNVHNSVISFDIRHAFCEPLHFPYLNPNNYMQVLTEYMQNTDYICASCTKTYLALKSQLPKLQKKPTILKVGSPSLDRYMRELSLNEHKFKVKRNVILALKKIFDKDVVIELINSLISNGNSIILRTHPDYFYDQATLAVVKYFDKNSSFIHDNISELSPQNMLESITLITDYSSVGYTYGLSLLRPVVLFRHLKVQTVNGYEYYEEAIHIECKTIEQIVNSVNWIEENKEQYEDKIRKYLENNVYNLMKSEKVIIETIKKILNQKIFKN